MGSAISVGNNTTFAPPCSKGENVADGETPQAEEFGARAQALASKYHDLRLRGKGDVSGEGRAAPPSLLGTWKASSPAQRSRSSPSPLPRAERKRLSRQLRRDDAVEQNGGERATGIALAPANG